jgi:hypothetical protein
MKEFAIQIYSPTGILCPFRASFWSYQTHTKEEPDTSPPCLATWARRFPPWCDGFWPTWANVGQTWARACAGSVPPWYDGFWHSWSRHMNTKDFSLNKIFLLSEVVPAVPESSTPCGEASGTGSGPRLAHVGPRGPKSITTWGKILAHVETKGDWV